MDYYSKCDMIVVHMNEYLAELEYRQSDKFTFQTPDSTDVINMITK